MPTDEPVRRTSEIEEFSNLYFIHPLAAWLTKLFARLGVRPNTVSFAGMAFGIGAGICYFHQGAGFAIAGLLLMIAWHVMDGADGQLARLTRTQSDLGKVLDGICDYVTFIAVYAGLGLALARQDGLWVLPLVAASGFFHAVQSAAYEAQRQAYDAWGWGRGEPPRRRLSGPRAGTAGLLYRGYGWVQRALAGAPARFDKTMDARLRARPEEAATLRAQYRRRFAPAVRRWSVLSANYRTLGIFLCVILGAPLAWFFLEGVGLTLVLAVLLLGQRRRAEAFLQLGETAQRAGRSRKIEPAISAAEGASSASAGCSP